MISIALETLTNRQTPTIRATSRHNGRTVTYYEGTPSQARQLLTKTLHDAASHHQLHPGVYCLKYIQLNDAARHELGARPSQLTLEVY